MAKASIPLKSRFENFINNLLRAARTKSMIPNYGIMEATPEPWLNTFRKPGNQGSA